MTEDLSLAAAAARDRADPLRSWRARFALPDARIYLDGNSLGPLPLQTIEAMRDMVERQWGEGLIASWNAAGWIDAPRRIGDKIARLVGARDGEVIVADSVSVNLFKLIGAIAQTRPQQKVLLSEAGNFPTDLHVAAGAALSFGLELRAVERDAIVDALDRGTAMLLLTHVHYKTGERFPMAEIEEAARQHGVPVLWDLSHSAGAVPVDLQACGARYAVGCGYKYLNGGPGAPAFLYVAADAQEALSNPIQGWMGHAAPFDFTDDYRPGPGLQRFLAGTPPMLAMAALESGVDLMLEADMAALWDKSVALFDWLAALMAERCPAMRPVTPHDPAHRGSHASFAHEHAWPINRALIDAGVTGDFRTPDVLRFGLTPLTLGFADIWHAVDRLAAILDEERWRRPEYQERLAVT